MRKKTMKGKLDFTINGVVSGPKGQRLALVCEDKAVRVWSVDEQRVISIREMNQIIFLIIIGMSMSFHPNGQQLAYTIGIGIGAVHLWSLIDQKESTLFTLREIRPFTRIRL